MIRTPQEFVNEVRARFGERLGDEIEEHGRTVMHFAEENNRLRAERDRLRDELESLQTSYNELHSELADKARNYEDVIAYHRRTEESLRDLVRRLVEYADAVTGYRPRTIEVVSSEHPAWTFDGAALLREARAAIGDEEK